MEMLPDKMYNEFNTDNATMMAVFFDCRHLGGRDHGRHPWRSAAIAGKQCFVSGMSALVTDLKDLCEQEEPIYVALAVALCLRRHDDLAGRLAGSLRVPGQHRHGHPA